MAVQLPDLLTRLASCAVFQVKTLSDEGKVRLLCDRADEKGVELPVESAQYILNRSERSIGRLLEILDRLDQSSLSAGRKLTIPFIKETMRW
ncbi:Chromosomal replication initiator protein DnaA [gamma proteobacterium IMCC2047]|nr:Chromosomal replication initiator protein DnaA [gamma proteobacterium IMCC2047]